MQGKNIGLQKRILEINPRAMFISCAMHTLNLLVAHCLQTYIIILYTKPDICVNICVCITKI